MSAPKIISIASPSWELSASFGRYALELKRVLEAKGIRINTLGPKAPDRLFTPTFVTLRIGYPTGYKIFSPLANIGLTLSLSTWESTKLHAEWVPILNAASAVLVPCQWNMDIYRDNGVIAPLYCMPHGISDIFQYVERPERKVFRFILIADRGQRKGFYEGMTAFSAAFGDREDVELVIKSRSLAPENILLNLANQNIRAINEEYDDAAMSQLYAEADCMIFATHAEGFGFPPREFAATGGIALATRYGGTADDIERWGFGIGYELEPAWTLDPNHRGCGEWAMPDIEQMAQTMKAVREMPLWMRNSLGKGFSQNIRQLYHWEDNADQILRVIEEIESRQEVRLAV